MLMTRKIIKKNFKIMLNLFWWVLHAEMPVLVHKPYTRPLWSGVALSHSPPSTRHPKKGLLREHAARLGRWGQVEAAMVGTGDRVWSWCRNPRTIVASVRPYLGAAQAAQGGWAVAEPAPCSSADVPGSPALSAAHSELLVTVPPCKSEKSTGWKGLLLNAKAVRGKA